MDFVGMYRQLRRQEPPGTLKYHEALSQRGRHGYMTDRSLGHVRIGRVEMNAVIPVVQNAQSIFVEHDVACTQIPVQPL